MKKPMIIMSICFVVSLFTLNFGTIFIIPIFCYLLENLIKLFVTSPTAVNGFRKFSSGIGWPAGYIKFLIAVPKVLVAISILASAAGIDFVIFPFCVGIVFFVINLIIEGFVIYACVLLYKYEMNNYMENIKRLEARNE
ncbi:hypothetical protein [Ligilactobacillus aviarius]|uniref:Uncharacterized protein n=1 Tax=Ligilactobacillus aviarius TaxID=1606 RepID=A0A179C5M6_9LACO|nr:hypothetical protein [Ligilactobacillus aviarius]OAP98916.1 hypothetical protein A3O07_05545 [Ligilactobacillus aviarius]OAP99968.1 hypothetical protein A3O08_03985 [Ligilactobacillus aviarius]OAQ00412.1 hypothetical protein A3O09_04330 [Ligilactobacillus aviarius]OAQ02991.1 hypothetical protein A3O13_00275 [Ligilactobacillus aviarius]OAQ06700.1 hypothetical protein A3O15_02030 [Ligilactobacillus aviarius]